MATTTKKGSKNKKAKLRGPVVKTSAAEQAQTIAELRQQLAESLQRENATAIENVRLLRNCRTATAISPKRWSSRRRQVRFCGSSQAPPLNSSRY